MELNYLIASRRKDQMKRKFDIITIFKSKQRNNHELLFFFHNLPICFFFSTPIKQKRPNKGQNVI